MNNKNSQKTRNKYSPQFKDQTNILSDKALDLIISMSYDVIFNSIETKLLSHPFVLPRYTLLKHILNNVLDNICILEHTFPMNWKIIFEEKFEVEFDEFAEAVQDECLAHLKVLEKFGPELGRPHVDTLKGSKHTNMKELRFSADNGVWRLAFAFDPDRQAILLVCGDKSGTSEKRFYRDLMKKADSRYDRHLAKLKRERTNG